MSLMWHMCWHTKGFSMDRAAYLPWCAGMSHIHREYNECVRVCGVQMCACQAPGVLDYQYIIHNYRRGVLLSTVQPFSVATFERKWPRNQNPPRHIAQWCIHINEQYASRKRHILMRKCFHIKCWFVKCFAFNVTQSQVKNVVNSSMSTPNSTGIIDSVFFT